MLSSLIITYKHRGQTIPDVRTATLPEGVRALPVISDIPCTDGCTACVERCPTDAIILQDGRVSLDTGACVFCGECADVCPPQKITFSNDHRTASTSRQGLIIAQGMPDPERIDPDDIRDEVRRLFGRSLKLRQVSAAGCNACELELNAAGNINFDMGRYGIEFVASPRHADGVVITGPISMNMAEANAICYDAVPDPKIVVLVGTCAISGGIFEHSPALQREWVDRVGVDLYVPGCPPHPLTFVNGILDVLRSQRS